MRGRPKYFLYWAGTTFYRKKVVLYLISGTRAKSISPALESQDSLEACHLVPEPTDGVVTPVPRSSDDDEDLGESLSNREVVECSWDATLSFFLQRKKVGRAGLEPVEQRGPGVSSSCPEEEGSGFELTLGKSVVVVNSSQDVEAAVDVNSQEEVLARHLDSEEDGSRRRVNQKRVARDFDGKAQKSFKVIRRKELKEKVILKSQRREKRAELDRFKKSYLEELGKSSKPNQLSEADSYSEEVRGILVQGKKVEGKEKEDKRFHRRKKLCADGADQSLEEGLGLGLMPCVELQEDEEEERRRLVRKEAEEAYLFNSRIGIKDPRSQRKVY
ncbi:hypothetical protein QQ045_020444 [Rhodiola kirilowii]